MSKIAIVYWSGTGNTEMMAKEIEAGAKAAGGDVSIFATSEFTADSAAVFDKFALGCPAMGAEELEDSEFQPLYEQLKPALSGKKVALFGSYGWGGGEYMTAWKNDAVSSGLILVDDPLAIENAPDDDGKSKCQELGKVLALA